MRYIMISVYIFLGTTAFASRSDDLPIDARPTVAYLKMRRSISFIESRDDPSARNRVTSASGKYQFMASWDRWFKREAGITWRSTVPKRSASKSVKAAMGQKQDRLFDRYYERVVGPWIRYVRAKGLGEKLSDPELVALAHRQGTIGAEKYLKTGIDPFAGKYGNRHVSAHLRAMRRAMQFEQYLDSQKLMVKGHG